MIYVGIGTAAILGGVLLYFTYKFGYQMGRASVASEGLEMVKEYV